MSRRRGELRKLSYKKIKKRLKQASFLGLEDEKIVENPHRLNKNIPWVCNCNLCKPKGELTYREKKEREIFKSAIKEAKEF